MVVYFRCKFKDLRITSTIIQEREKTNALAKAERAALPFLCLLFYSRLGWYPPLWVRVNFTQSANLNANLFKKHIQKYI